MSTILHKRFNIDTHKREFRNTYLEVVIAPNGVVEYAVPSHTLKLTKIACKKLGVKEQELQDLAPMEYWADMMLWLCRLTSYITVWDNFFEGEPNRKQYQMLTRLKQEGLYGGSIHRYGFLEVADYNMIEKARGKKLELKTTFPNQIQKGKIVVRFILKHCDIHVDSKKSVIVSGLTAQHISGLYSGDLIKK